MSHAALIAALALLPCAAPSLQDKKDPDVALVTLDIENGTIGEIVESFQLVTGIPIEFDQAARQKVDPAKVKASLKIQNTPLTGALKLLLSHHGLEVRSVDRKKVLITVPKGK